MTNAKDMAVRGKPPSDGLLGAKRSFCLNGVPDSIMRFSYSPLICR